MSHHLLALTIDVDPDGLSGETTNRQTLTWDSLHKLPWFTGELPDALTPIPVTWFVRADGSVLPLHLYDWDATGELLEFELEMEDGFTEVEIGS